MLIYLSSLTILDKAIYSAFIEDNNTVFYL